MILRQQRLRRILSLSRTIIETEFTEHGIWKATANIGSTHFVCFSVLSEEDAIDGIKDSLKRYNLSEESVKE